MLQCAATDCAIAPDPPLPQVTLVIPWLTKADQESIFPNVTFESPEQQEEYVREWARKRTGVDTPFKVCLAACMSGLNALASLSRLDMLFCSHPSRCACQVQFYPGKYAPEKGSILPVGDLTQYIPDSEVHGAMSGS